MKKNMRRLTLRVTAQTLYNLERLRQMGELRDLGRVVDKLVREKMGIENILINCIGSVIGSHTGPGVVAVFCMGEKR